VCTLSISLMLGTVQCVCVSLRHCDFSSRPVKHESGVFCGIAVCSFMAVTTRIVRCLLLLRVAVFEVTLGLCLSCPVGLEPCCSCLAPVPWQSGCEGPEAGCRLCRAVALSAGEHRRRAVPSLAGRGNREVRRPCEALSSEGSLSTLDTGVFIV